MQQDDGFSVYVRDPDGNKIELYGKRRASWPHIISHPAIKNDSGTVWRSGGRALKVATKQQRRKLHEADILPLKANASSAGSDGPAITPAKPMLNRSATSPRLSQPARRIGASPLMD
jgi:hypothetical protein